MSRLLKRKKNALASLVSGCVIYGFVDVVYKRLWVFILFQTAFWDLRL